MMKGVQTPHLIFTNTLPSYIMFIRNERLFRKGVIMTEQSKTLMEQAIKQAEKTMKQDKGGPFGALIVDADNQVISVASNTVLADHDPTAHAEINAIRKATKKMGTHDLSGCTLYTTAHPCPMCLGAIMWSNIKTVIYGCRPEDARSIGFRDDHMYEFIENGHDDDTVLKLEERHRDSCLSLFKEYASLDKTIY